MADNRRVTRSIKLAAAAAAIVLLQAVGVEAAEAATCPTGGAYASAVLATAGVQGFWRLDDAPGTSSACDALGAHSGSYDGDVQLGVAGALSGDADTAANFDGSSANAAVPDAAALDMGDSFSVDAWVKRFGIGGSENQAIASKQNSSWVLMFNPANQLVLRKSNTGDVVASTVTLTDTTAWHHVAATKSGSSVHLYIDGRDVTGPVTTRTMADNDLPLAIGQSSQAAYFDGGIDEVAVYRGELPAATIKSHYDTGHPASTTPPPPPTGDPVVAITGDIACDPASSAFNGGFGTSTRCRAAYVATLLDDTLSGILALGDNQYEDGTLAAFRQSYDGPWGPFKAITHPIAGNHEYANGASNADGYFDYFNGVGRSSGSAGKRGQGWYSFDIGSWHLIALNSNCDEVGCTAGSAQEQWLKADLAAHKRKCTLAYWHHPRWTSGGEGDGNATYMSPLYKDLYNANADLLFAGHDHDYERFAPQNPTANVDKSRGIREFVVGTGGKNHHAWGTFARNSEVRNNSTYGLLRLTLKPSGYDYKFVPEPGATFTDSGSGTCH